MTLFSKICQSAPPLPAMLLVATLCATTWADDIQAPLSDNRLQEALAATISWSARRVPLCDQLTDIQTQSGISIIRDRRLDPRFTVSVDTGFVTRLTVLQQIASAIPDCLAMPTDKYVILGPTSSVNLLPILLDLCESQQAAWKRLPLAHGRKSTQPMTTNWEQLAEPRTILTKAAKESGVVIRNPEAIPHDAWDARRLPRMTFLELSALILIQFDLYAVADSKSATVTITSVSEAEPLEYRHTLTSRQKSRLMTEWQKRFPGLPVRWSASSATFTADLKTHAEFRQLVRTTATESSNVKNATTDSLRTRLFQLKAERATLGSVIESFRANGIVVEIPRENSPAVQKHLKTLIPLDQATEKLPGSKFFPQLFSNYFQSVEVHDGQIILTP
jgi:hypothetical protein